MLTIYLIELSKETLNCVFLIGRKLQQQCAALQSVFELVN